MYHHEVVWESGKGRDVVLALFGSYRRKGNGTIAFRIDDDKVDDIESRCRLWTRTSEAWTHFFLLSFFFLGGKIFGEFMCFCYNDGLHTPAPPPFCLDLS